MAATDWTTLQAKTSYYQTTYETSCCSNASVYNNQDFVAWQEEAYQIATTWYDGKFPLRLKSFEFSQPN